MARADRAPDKPVVIPDGAGWAVYRRLLAYAKPHWPMFLLGVFGMALFAAVDTGLAWLVKRFLDGAFVEKDPDTLVLVPAGIIILFTARGIGDWLSNFAPGWVGRHVIKAMRREVFAHYLRLPTAFFDKAGSAQLLSRLTYNIEMVAEAATTAVTSMIRDTLTIIGLFGWLFYNNWRLTLFALAVAPLIVGLMRVTNRRFRRYSTRIQGSMGDVTRVAKEAIEGHRAIKVFNAQAAEAALFERANEHNRASYMKLITVKAVSNPVVQMIASLGLAAVMWVAIRDVLHNAMSVGEFTSFLTALLLVTAPLRRLINVAGPLQQGIAAGQSVFEVLDQAPEGEGGPRAIERARGEVEFRDVSFTYDDDKGAVLHDVNLLARPGERVAIVGRSGSGKSTLVSLLPRFYDPRQGVVMLDGVDVREYRLRDLRNQVSLVSQDVVLVNDSIRNNIAFSRPESTPAQVEAAAQAAHVMEFAGALPEGLDTQVGDRGSQLSGGQRQRVAIARALLKDAPVLILDEATSALDSESERTIQAALDVLLQGRTTLVIAHRLSTIEQADRILVMEDGRVIESGTHAELIAAGKAYASLHRLQFNA
ncbi:MAG: lipid A export permease/ATP-binding protein MsbA [Gammaproteobacteria bacterium]|nr:lipid A export permease/ATP-binding protein MsbA [Gammaproteobacteria bacterium]